MTTRTCFYIFAAALALVVAATNAESTASEESFAEATSFVQAYMSEGKGDSACRQVADDAIKTIKDECAALQKTVDTAAKAGSACCNSGKSGVDAAKKAKDDVDGKSSTCESERKAIANSQIKFDTTMKDLKKRKCNAVFGSRAYKDMKRKLDNKDKECEQLKGEGKQAKKALYAAVCAAKESRKKCVKRSKTALKAAFKDADKVCSSTQNKKSFTRAMHMKCVLDGKSLGKCGAGKPPTVTSTSFSKLTCPATTVGSIKPCHLRDAAAKVAAAKAKVVAAARAAAEKVAAAKAKALALAAKVAAAKAKAAKVKAEKAEAKAAKAKAAKEQAAERAAEKARSLKRAAVAKVAAAKAKVAKAKAAKAEAKAAKLAAAAKVAAAKAKAAKKGFPDCNQYGPKSKSSCSNNYRLSTQKSWYLYKQWGNKGTLKGKKCSGKDDVVCNCQYKCQKTKRCKSFDVLYAGGGDKKCVLFKRKCSRRGSSDGVGGGVCRDGSINGGVDQYQ